MLWLVAPQLKEDSHLAMHTMVPMVLEGKPAFLKYPATAHALSAESLGSAALTAEPVVQVKTEEGRPAASAADMQDAPTAPLTHQAQDSVEDVHALSFVMPSTAESA